MCRIPRLYTYFKEYDSNLIKEMVSDGLLIQTVTPVCFKKLLSGTVTGAHALLGICFLFAEHV